MIDLQKTATDILLALLGFLLGIVATLLTQFVNRRMQYTDAKRKKRLERLAIINEWMEATRQLINCKYPDDPAIAFVLLADLESDDKFSRNLFTEISSKIIYDILLVYQQASQKHQEAERKGQEALRILQDKNIIFQIKRIIFSRSKDVINHLRSPIQKKIYPNIHVILSSELYIYNLYPRQFRNDVLWEKLKHIKPTEVREVFYTLALHDEKIISSAEQASKYILGESELGTEKYKIRKHRANAINSIDKIVEIIQEFEEKWIIPIK